MPGDVAFSDRYGRSDRRDDSPFSLIMESAG